MTIHARRLAACAGLACVLGIAACGSSDLDSRLERRAAELRQEYRMPGLQVACALPDGRVVRVAAGLADSTTGAAMTTAHLLPAGSVGKTGLAAVVLSLVQDGTLDLDAPVSRWLGDEPWFARLPNAGPALTLRRLMNHASGLPDHLETDAFVAFCREMVRPGGTPDAVLSPREAVSFILDQEPLFPVGEGFRYTDTAYLVAGLVVERATGRAYYDLLRERFLEPLGFDGIVPQDRRDLPGVANGYVAADNPFGMPTHTLDPDGRFNHNPVLEWTGGGLVTRSGDLARWIRLLYGGTLLAAPYLDDLLRGQPMPSDFKGPGRYGLAVFVQDSPRGELRWHSGYYPGYNTMARYWPDRDLALVVQVNRDHDTHLAEVCAELERVVFGD
ncbi:MAG: serine hydrolase domain-containing protein [Candidatus Krumholzibacteriia bacterium]